MTADSSAYPIRPIGHDGPRPAVDTCILFVAPARWHDHDDVEKVLFSTGADVSCVDSLSRALFLSNEFVYVD